MYRNVPFRHRGQFWSDSINLSRIIDVNKYGLLLLWTLFFQPEITAAQPTANALLLDGTNDSQGKAIRSSTSGQSTVVRAGFTPFALRHNIDTAILEVEIRDTSVVYIKVDPFPSFIARDGAIITEPYMLVDDGTHGDIQSGDNVFTIDGISLQYATSPNDVYTQWFETNIFTLVHRDNSETKLVNSDGKFRLHTFNPITISIPNVHRGGFAENIHYTDHVVNVVLDIEDESTDSFVDPIPYDWRQAIDQYYTYWPDDKDFIFYDFMFNRSSSPAWYAAIKNEVTGLGLPIIDKSSLYGGGERLQGAIYLFRWFSFRQLNHEILHRWATYLDKTLDLEANNGHWGTIVKSSSGFGCGHYNGVFDSIEETGPGEYAANTLNCTWHYNDIELYLMGLISAEEVADTVRTLVNPKLQSIDQGKLFYSADSMREVPFSEVLSKSGGRMPAQPDAQKDFTSAFIAIHFRPLTDTEFAIYEFKMIEYEQARSTYDLTFEDATGGRATISTSINSMANSNPTLVRAIDDVDLRVGEDRFDTNLRDVFSDADGE